jgi:D-sedoheptulose 7-phosphate isomerase
MGNRGPEGKKRGIPLLCDNPEPAVFILAQMGGNGMRIPITGAIASSLEEARSALAAFSADAGNQAAVARMAEGLAACFRGGGKALACGNGGSACDALHFAEEFTGRFRGDRPALPVIPLLESAHLTCVANDYGFDRVFSRGVEAFGKAGDVLLAISTSGNSANVIRAVEAARQAKMKVFLLLGKEGGALRGKGDEEIWVRSPNTERVQEVHMTVLHVVIECVERILFPDHYPPA